METASYLEGQELEEDRHAKRMHARCFVKRKLGSEPEKHELEKSKNYQRVKTFQAIMALDNMMNHTAGKRLWDYEVKFDVDGKPLLSPWRWPHFHWVPDMGPDMVSAKNFMKNKLKLNGDCDFDLSHGLQRSAQGALKAAGLWNFQVAMVAAQNCVYGSTLSPPRLAQVREAMQEHMDATPLSEDALLQLQLPYICKQLGVNFDVSADGQDLDVHAMIRNHKMLYNKFDKVNLGKYQQTTFNARRGLSIWIGI